MHLPKAPLTALSVATLLAVIGCGGSSSSGGNPDPNPTPNPGNGNGNGGGETAPIQITGEAVKGVLKNAEVTAYELNDQGERLEGIITTPTTTNAQGEYALELQSNYGGGLLEVVVTASESTTMVCDASRCGDARQGEEIPVTGDFSLTTIAEKDEGSDTVTASATAWSTMAAQRSIALVQAGKTLNEARRQANAEVSQVVGFDITKRRALGVSQLDQASDAEAQYALMNAAVAEVVFRDSGADLAEQVQQFASALNDGKLGNSDDGFSATDLAQAVVRAANANAAQLSDTVSDYIANQSARLESAGSAGFTPDYDEELVVDENASDADKIAAYQAFMGQTRTWLSSIDELSSEDLLNAVTVDEDTLRATMDADTQTRFQYLGEVVGQVTEHAYTNVDVLVEKLENGGTETIDIVDTQGNNVGRAELVFADDDGLVITAKGWALDDAGAEFEPFELSLATSIPVDDITIDRVDQEVVGARIARLLTENTLSVSAQIGDANSSHYLTLNNTRLTVQMDTNIESEEGVFDGDAIKSALKAASINGNVAINSDGYRFNGSASFELVRLSDEARLFPDTDRGGDVLAPKAARLSGEFVSADDATRFNAVVSLNLRNAAAFDTFNWWFTSGSQVMYLEPLPASAREDIRENASPSDQVVGDSIFLGWTPTRSTYYNTYYVEDLSQTETIRLDSLTDAQQSQISQEVLSLLPDDFQVEVTSDAEPTLDENGDTVNEAQDVTEVISGAELLLSGTLTELTLHSEDITSNNSVRLSIAYEGEVSDSAVSISHFYQEAQVSKVGEALNIKLIWPAGEDTILHDALAGLEHELIDLGSPTSLFGYSGSDWSLYLDVPKSQAAYEYCIENPGVLLSFDTNNVLGACLLRTLVQTSEDRALTETEEAALKGVVGRQLDNTAVADLPYELVSATAGISGGTGTMTPYDQYWHAAVEIDDLERSDYYLQGSVTASLGITLPDLPAAQLTTTFNRTGQHAGSIRANVDWDGGNYTLDIAGSSLDNPESLNLRFFNAQGYELSLVARVPEGEVTDLTGEASIDGDVVGHVEWREGQPVLVFQDGEETEIQSLF